MKLHKLFLNTVKLTKYSTSSFFLKKQGGFTLVELVVVMAIFSILSTVITVNLLGVKHQASLNTSVTTLVSDLKNQQLKAMLGDTEGAAENNSYGIYFEPSRYIQFQGSSYNAGDPNNFIVDLDSSLEFKNIIFPSSSIVFSKGSGEISGFIDGSNTLTLSNTATPEEKTLVLNRYGVITEAN